MFKNPLYEKDFKNFVMQYEKREDLHKGADMKDIIKKEGFMDDLMNRSFEDDEEDERYN